MARRRRAPRAHPFAATADAVAEAVAEHAGPAADLVVKAVDDELTLWLAATADGPLASPDLIRAPENQPPAGTRRSALRAWRVLALTFEPAAALDLLGVLGESQRRGSQAVQGGSVHYLAAVARLAGDLAARGRVLPALTIGGSEPVGTRDFSIGAGGIGAGGISASGAGSDGDGDAGVAGEGEGRYAAKWRPVLSGADAQRARELAVAMPPLCRATTAAGEPSARVLMAILDVLTDAAARASLCRQPGFTLLPARRGGGTRSRARGMARRGAGSGWSGPHLLPAGRAAGARNGRDERRGVGRERHGTCRDGHGICRERHGTCRDGHGICRERRGTALDGRTRPSVDQRPEPAAARARCLVRRERGRLGSGRDPAPGGRAARRARPRIPAVPRA